MPIRVISGAGCARETVREVIQLNARKVLIVITDPGVSKTGLPSEIAGVLGVFIK
ncbi:MAG: hypothetical protein ACLQVJ_06050 [Syntrophobacteraceae bacterium]